MNGILLDTSAYSNLTLGDKNLLDIVQTAENIVVNPVILGELRSGFALGTQEQHNLKLLDRFLASPRSVIIPVTEETSSRYAHILCSLRKAGTPIPTNDLWIAATAMEHGLPVVTLDKHFTRIPQIICRLAIPGRW